MKNRKTIEQSETDNSKDTKTRKAILKNLEDHRLPITELQLRAKLSASGIEVNKTTIYRQLSHLKKSNFIREIDFGDGKKRYELNSGDHHHHLVCTNCNHVDEVHMEDDLVQIERNISRNKNFKIINHSLEFFGLCKNCK